MTAQVGGASPLSSMVVTTRQDDVNPEQRSVLRRQLRRIRRSLSRQQQQQAAWAVAHTLLRAPCIKPGARIGIYLAMPGELDLAPFIKLAWLRHCQLFVPHITHARRRQMVFAHFTPASRLRNHQWGMTQLSGSPSAIASLMLDVVLVPLVGFDGSGNRLGMGAGFYDRHFARLRRNQQYERHWRRPHLMGVAYACQQVTALPPQAHDVRLDAVVTERGWVRGEATNTR
jgi:5-formyltetrahydrofolate cyclo-ligase